MTMIITSVGSILGLEASLDLSGGHPKTRALIQWCIDLLEPDRAG